MISKSIMDAVIKQAPTINKDMMLSNMITHISDRSYNDGKINHILDVLLNTKLLIESKHINLDYINSNFNKLIYNRENYDIKDIKVERVDNIDCVVYIEYYKKLKSDEYNETIKFIKDTDAISFIDYPEVLKKS